MFAFTFIPLISHGSTLSLTNAQDNGCQARKMTTMGLYLGVAGTATISPLLGNAQFYFSDPLSNVPSKLQGHSGMMLRHAWGLSDPPTGAGSIISHGLCEIG